MKLHLIYQALRCLMHPVCLVLKREQTILFIVLLTSVCQIAHAKPPEWTLMIQQEGYIMDMQWYQDQLLVATQYRLVSISPSGQIDTLFDRGQTIAQIAVSGDAIMVLSVFMPQRRGYALKLTGSSNRISSRARVRTGEGYIRAFLSEDGYDFQSYQLPFMPQQVVATHSGFWLWGDTDKVSYVPRNINKAQLRYDIHLPVGKQITRLATDGNQVYLATTAGIYQQQDIGWQCISDRPADYLWAKDGRLFASAQMQPKLYRADDSGNFVPTGLGLPHHTTKFTDREVITDQAFIQISSDHLKYVFHDETKRRQLWTVPQPEEDWFMCFLAGEDYILAGTYRGKIYQLNVNL
ncbi:MAG: hypothetical protein AAF632_28115 [Bacteroidota bacterium]